MCYPDKSSICTNIGGIHGLYLFMFLFNVPLFGTACYVKSKLQFEISSHTSIIFLLQVKSEIPMLLHHSGLIPGIHPKYSFKVIISPISLGSLNLMLISAFDHWKYSDISIGNRATVILGTFNNNKQCDA